MISERFTPKRYQLNKSALHIVDSGHPWIFRNQLSSAATVYPTGQWLKLFDPENQLVAHGIYESEGLIGIRVIKHGPTPPDITWLVRKLETALKRREPLRQYTNSFRLIHGENDGLPGVVLDIYNDTAVLQTYSPSADSMGRFAGIWATQKLSLKNLIWKLPAKRRSEGSETKLRILKGTMPNRCQVKEGSFSYEVDIRSGQKSGSFLDLRGLRKWLFKESWKGKKILNLFSYTGVLGYAAFEGVVTNVDIAAGALEFGKKFHNTAQSQWVNANVFSWINELKSSFDLVIVDPPMMAAVTSQVNTALNAYRKIYTELSNHLNPRGILVACCCTSRIPRKTFEEAVFKALGGKLRLIKRLPTEDDHPVKFREADYLKIMIFQRR